MIPLILNKLKNFTNTVEFEDNLMRVSYQNIKYAFIYEAEGFFRRSKKVDDNMLLGWDTIAKFKKKDKRFELQKIAPGGCGSEAKIEDKYEKIVTMAVDTCTFVLLESEDIVVMAHLDKNHLEKGLGIIESYLPKDSKDITGFCSYIEEKNRKIFVEKLRDLYGDGIKTFNRIDCNNSDFYYGHYEIGIHLDDNEKCNIFGDLTYNPISEKNNTTSYRFNTFKELEEITQGNNKLSCGCGCCLLT
ncbi:MAG: hypothetical protein ACI4MN_01955 [Candidatus Coproplasma sp.]